MCCQHLPLGFVILGLMFMWTTTPLLMLGKALKQVFAVASAANFQLSLIYVPSHLNLADLPSCALSLQDTTLAPTTWQKIQFHYGGALGHSVELRALLSNSMIDRHSSRLPFFSPCPTPGCLGVNVFTQPPSLYPSKVFSNPMFSHLSS